MSIKKTKSIISLTLIMLVLLTVCGRFTSSVQAASISQSYEEDILIGFQSMGDINSLNFTLTGDYYIEENSAALKKDVSYKIQYSDSVFKVYENDSVIFQSSNNVTIKPLSAGTFIRFIKEGYNRKFAGDMIFKKKDNNYFIPINRLKMEDYLKGVLPFEMGDSFPLEALKAQAVAARTYAIANKGRYSSSGYDLTDDTYTQVYRGYVDSATKSNEAVESTKGKILTYGGTPINAYFSASNGGYMERNDYVWQGEWMPYLIEEIDVYDIAQKGWTVDKNDDDIDALLKQKYPSLEVKQFISIDISNMKFYPSSRISEMSIIYKDNNNITKNLVLTKDKARTFFGLKSALYTVSVKKDTTTNKNIYTFTGNGYGHGIGLSQWGAYYRANAGQSYITILNFYYRNAVLEDASGGGAIAQFQKRIGGSNRYETALAISQNSFIGQVDNVVITTGTSFADALSGSSLAKKLNAPILLVDNNISSNNEVYDYMHNQLKPGGKIYILGGENAVSKQFYDNLIELGYNNNQIVRIGGKDRIETSYLIANEMNSSVSTPLVIATGESFPDALSISPIAAANGWPVMLVNKDNISNDLKEYLTNKTPSKIYVVGGTGVVSDDIVNSIREILNYSEDKIERLGGNNRYDTSRIIASKFLQSPDEIVLSSGQDFPDALSGSIYASLKGSPIILVNSSEMNEAENYIKLVGNNKTKVMLTVLGLEGAVKDSIIDYLTSVK